MGFKGSSIALYDSMRRAWQDAGGGAADGGAIRRSGTSRPQTTEQPLRLKGWPCFVSLVRSGQAGTAIMAVMVVTPQS